MNQGEALWREARKRADQARRSGVLQPIGTEPAFLEEGGVRFLVRVVQSLARKDKAAAQPGRNPFLPPEPELLVADVTATHRLVLNKFNVIDDHLLLVTRDFEEQRSALTLADFAALLPCLAGRESLAFYNAGETAGASQRHKHLQLVPLPLAPDGPAVPIEPLLSPAEQQGAVARAPRLPFPHALSVLPAPSGASDALDPAGAHDRYCRMLHAVGLDGGAARAGGDPGPYNLLMTRRCLLLVPRVKERFESISINALGFAGALLVRDEAERELLRQRGPLAALRAVAGTLNG